MTSPRLKVRFGDVKPKGVFYTTEKSRIRYRKLPHSEIMEMDMGHRYPATIYSWVREDWVGKIHRHHSWSGDPADVWIEE